MGFSIRMFDLATLGEPGSKPEGLATAHESPDGMAWSPLRVEVVR